MKLKQLLAAAIIALAGSTAAQAQQPYTGCWHPDDIKDWSPATDPDAKFNRSTVKWAPRFKEPELMKANASQFYEGQVCNATILYQTCSMSPAQGANVFTAYQPCFWQYMDKLVYWAGSASEGIICPPPAPSIDAAHLNGVKVLGQIFFPPSYYGGQQAWVRQMLSTDENGKYTYAIKLYEIAKYFGFEGWFINEETGGGTTDEWVGFIKEFNAAAEADGIDYMEIQWYNASGYPNTTILSTNKNTSQFLEYGYAGDYRSYADQISYPDGTQCTEEETFSKIYAGVQVVNSGHTGFNYYLNEAYPETGHVGSLDLFCPEERIWKDNMSSLLGTSNATGEKAYAAQVKTFQNESQMWVNRDGDPTTGGSSTWRGISGAILERSVISAMPFYSDMANGLGKYRFVEGEKKNTQDWNHSGMQSILPTWRWWIENRGDLTVAEDWDDAYNVGSSYKFSGSLTAGDHLVRLYKTMVPITSGGTLRVVYKANGGSVVPVVSTESSTTEGQLSLSNPTTTTKNGWTIDEYSLASLNGKTIYMIALNLKAEAAVSSYTMNLGQIAMLPAGYNPTAPTVENLTVEGQLGEEKGNLRLTWDCTTTDDFDHFDIYAKTSASTNLIGQTRGEAFYVSTFERNGTDASIEIQVVPVMKGGSQGQAATATADYPKPTTPVVTLKVSKSYTMVGEEITLTAKGTQNPTAWNWVMPEGLELVEGQGTNQVKVKCTAAGQKQVTIEATNTVGTSTTTLGAVDVFDSEDDYSNVANVILNKTVVSYSGSTNSTEVPDRIIDGVTNPTATSQKWCNINSEHWAIFDLEGSYRIYGFKIYDCKSGPESNENIPNYRIYLSDDGENWTLYVDEEGRDADNIKEDYISPATARYVKLNPWSETGFTLRIWEFEVYGYDANNMTISLPTTLRMNTSTAQNIEVAYNLNGDVRSNNFTCEAVSKDGKVQIGKITEDKEASKFTIPLMTYGKVGTDVITVKVTNGGKYREANINLTIDDPTLTNILAGKEATLRHYKTDYSFSAAYDEYTTSKLTDGDTQSEALELIENPSTHTEDFWAIFSSDEAMNIAKMKVYFYNKNQGVNDNDKAGYSNNTVYLRSSNDGLDWTTLATFDNLTEVESLEYILPETISANYIAVTCNLNAYFYPSLSEIEAYVVEEEVPSWKAASLSGFDIDVIAEASPAEDYTTTSLDDNNSGGNYVYFSSTYQEDGALPADGMITSESEDYGFQLQPYDQDNAIKIGNSYTEKTLTFDEEVYTGGLHILGTSANGSSTANVELTFNDETTETYTISLNDWYGTTGFLTGLNRVQRGTDDIGEGFRMDAQTIGFSNFRCPVKATFSRASGSGYPIIFAITYDNVTTGISNAISTAEATPAAIYTIDGIKTTRLSRGLNIVKMTNGKVKKVLVR